MSDDKKHSDDIGATVMMPAQDVSVTQIIHPEELNAKEDIAATVIITPVDIDKSEDFIDPDRATRILPAASVPSADGIGETGEMGAIPSSRASAFDILLGRTEPVEARQFELKKNKLTIGRSPFNDIIIKSASVSASHAELERVKGCWVLRDVGSVNGICVNGEYGGKGDEFDLSISDQILLGEVVLQLCSPHTIDETLATKLITEPPSANKILYIIAGAVAVVALVAVLFLV